MKKVLAACSFAALLVSSACAEGAFVGAEGGWFHWQDKIGDYKDNGNNMIDLGLKLGYIITDNHRVYGTYHYDFATSSGYGKIHKILLGYDFTPQIYNEWRGVLGLYGGYSLLYHDGSSNGFAYGAKAGALYEINQNNEVEFGFKGEQLRYSEERLTNLGLYLGYAYKF